MLHGQPRRLRQHLVLAATVVGRRPERGVAEPHQRVGGHLVHPELEAADEVVQERPGVGVVVLDVEDQVGVHQVEPADRVRECLPGLPRVVRTAQVVQDLVGERLDADADRGEAEPAQGVQALRRGVGRQHLDGTLPGHRERVEHGAQQVREERRRAAPHVQGGEARCAGRSRLDVAAGLGQQRVEVAFRLARAGNHLVVRAERAHPRAERHVHVHAERPVGQLDHARG